MKPEPRFSTDPEMNTALEADEAKLIALGAYDQHPYAKSARADERAAVVKYLRRTEKAISDAFYARVVGNIADEIERGKHL